MFFRGVGQPPTSVDNGLLGTFMWSLEMYEANFELQMMVRTGIFARVSFKNKQNPGRWVGELFSTMNNIDCTCTWHKNTLVDMVYYNDSENILKTLVS